MICNYHELKSSRNYYHPVWEAQLLSYLKLSNKDWDIYQLYSAINERMALKD
jgi:hypothetical protein